MDTLVLNDESSRRIKSSDAMKQISLNCPVLSPSMSIQFLLMCKGTGLNQVLRIIERTPFCSTTTTLDTSRVTMLCNKCHSIVQNFHHVCPSNSSSCARKPILFRSYESLNAHLSAPRIYSLTGWYQRLTREMLSIRKCEIPGTHQALNTYIQL